MLRIVVAGVLLSIGLPAKSGAQFADLRGRIVFDGDPPAPDEHGPALTINPGNGGVADVLVYVRKTTVVDPERTAIPPEPAILTVKNDRFLPAVMVIRCGQQVVLRSEDQFPHSLRTWSVANEGAICTVAGRDLTGIKIPIDKVNAKPEPLPVRIDCILRGQMEGYWLIVDHPYAAVTDSDGRFLIPGLPVGQQTLTVWHSTTGYIHKGWKVEVGANGPALARLKVIDRHPGRGVRPAPAAE